MSVKRVLLSGILLVSGACDAIPRDPEGTLDRVRAGRVMRVGMIAAAPAAPTRLVEDRFVAALEARTGAKALRHVDSSERLLVRLEQGGLDVVVGEFSTESPWKARVTILPPLKPHRDTEEIAPAVAVRNGENAWVALLVRTMHEDGGE